MEDAEDLRRFEAVASGELVSMAAVRNAVLAWFQDAAGLHFVIALVFLLVAGTGIKRPVFRATMEELKRDREWLKDLEANQPRN